MTLRVKILLILVVTVVLSLGGSGLFFLHHFELAFRKSVYQTLDSIARDSAKTLSDYLLLQHRVVKHIGLMLPRDALDLKDWIWVESYLADHGRDFNFFANGFFYLDEKGILRSDFPAHPETRENSFSYRPYFQQTMAQRHGVISEPYYSARTDEAVLTFTSYLASRDNRPLGLLGGSIRLLDDAVLTTLRNTRIGETGYLYVFDKSRMIILHPDDTRMLARDVPAGVNRMFDAAIDGFTGTGETVNSDGGKMFVAIYPVTGTDWLVAAQQPVEEALQPLADSQRPLVMFIVGGSLVAALAGMLLVHRSMRGLVRLESVTAELAIPEAGLEQVENLLQDEAEKLNDLSHHKEFGPLAMTIRTLYSRLGLTLAKTRRMATELEVANQQLQDTQLQILQQEKMASIGQLAAGVAHEINNPMGFITSNLGTLRRYQEKMLAYQQQLEAWLIQADGQLQEQLLAERKRLKIDYVMDDIQDLVAESTEGAERVREIVQNLKSFSRVDQVEYTEADINECLESTLAIAWNEIKYKAQVEKSFGELPLLPCYPQQLNQVFLNILVNAAQAIEEQGVIRIRTWQEGSRVLIAISDTGPGIPETIRQRIFEPFFTTKEVGLGTGLGMSISYEIIQKHRGDIRVESALGQGTTFTIELPLQREGEA